MLRDVTFKNGDIDLAGKLYLPDDFVETNRYPVIVCIHPSGGIKEQTGAVYAEHLARKGFLALISDASFIGESGGEPRFVEEPAVRVEDVRCAVDFLTTLSFVDQDRIGVLGVGTAGGYAVNVAMTERRIAAVGAIVPVEIGTSRRVVAERSGGVIEMLEKVGRQRTREANGAEPRIEHWLPNSREELEQAGIGEGDVADAVDYYTNRAPRGMYANNYRFTRLASMIAFDAFHLVEELLTQPLQIIVGNRMGTYNSYQQGRDLFERAKCDKDFLVVDGASHYDLFDQPEAVGQAVSQLERFYTKAFDRAE